MWIMLNDAFFSIVHKDCARDEVLVRARRKGDIEKVFPETKGSVKRDDFTDYLFRAPIKREALAKALAGEVERITYSNFKDSVKDDRLHSAYHRVWGALLPLQPMRPRQRSLFGHSDLDYMPKHDLGGDKPSRRRRRRKSLKRGQ